MYIIKRTELDQRGGPQLRQPLLHLDGGLAEALLLVHGRAQAEDAELDLVGFWVMGFVILIWVEWDFSRPGPDRRIHLHVDICINKSRQNYLGEQRLGDPEVVRRVLQPRVQRGGGGRGGPLGPGGAEEDEEAFLLLWFRGWWLVGGTGVSRGSVGRGLTRAHTGTEPHQTIN